MKQLGVLNRDSTVETSGFLVVTAGVETEHDTFALAHTACVSGSTFKLPRGVTVVGNTVVKSGVHYVGHGPGLWDGSAVQYNGGTLLEGAFTSTASQTGYSLDNIGLHCTGVADGSFLGTHGVDVNSRVTNCNFYGTGSNTHNIEWRGQNVFVENVGSYDAGTHPFPVKTETSIFRNIHIQDGSAVQPKMYVKADAAGEDMPDNVFENVTAEGGYITVESFAGRVISGTVFRNCVVNMTGAGVGMDFKSSIGTNGQVNNTRVIDCSINDTAFGLAGIGVDGTTAGAVDGIFISGCVFDTCTLSCVTNNDHATLSALNMEVKDCTFINSGNSIGGKTGAGFLTEFDEYSSQEVGNEQLLISGEHSDIGTTVGDLVTGMGGSNYRGDSWNSNAGSTAGFGWMIKIQPNTDILRLTTTFYGLEAETPVDFRWELSGLNQTSPPVATFNVSPTLDVDFGGEPTNGGGYSTLIFVTEFDLSSVSLINSDGGTPLYAKLYTNETRSGTQKIWAIGIEQEQVR